jgi:hypothetical protein
MARESLEKAKNEAASQSSDIGRICLTYSIVSYLYFFVVLYRQSRPTQCPSDNQAPQERERSPRAVIVHAHRYCLVLVERIITAIEA